MKDPHNAAPFKTTGTAVAEESFVFLDGLDSMTILLTPGGAEQIGKSLIAAA